MHMSTSIVEFGLAGAYTDFVHVVITAVGPYAQIPCCVRETQFTCSHLPPGSYSLFVCSLAITHGFWQEEL